MNPFGRCMVSCRFTASTQLNFFRRKRCAINFAIFFFICNERWTRFAIAIYRFSLYRNGSESIGRRQSNPIHFRTKFILLLVVKMGIYIEYRFALSHSPIGSNILHFHLMAKSLLSFHRPFVFIFVVVISAVVASFHVQSTLFVYATANFVHTYRLYVSIRDANNVLFAGYEAKWSYKWILRSVDEIFSHVFFFFLFAFGRPTKVSKGE